MKRHWPAAAALAAITTFAGCADDRSSIESSVEARTPEDRGRALVAERGCTACHALDATRGIGPGWGGIYGSTQPLKGGGSVVVDDEYLRRSMLEPSAEIVDGYDSLMVPAAVNEAQIADIIALIKSLGSATTP